jgi:hypothetical protein
MKMSKENDVTDTNTYMKTYIQRKHAWRAIPSSMSEYNASS